MIKNIEDLRTAVTGLIHNDDVDGILDLINPQNYQIVRRAAVEERSIKSLVGLLRTNPFFDGWSEEEIIAFIKQANKKLEKK